MVKDRSYFLLYCYDLYKIIIMKEFHFLIINNYERVSLASSHSKNANIKLEFDKPTAYSTLMLLFV